MSGDTLSIAVEQGAAGAPLANASYGFVLVPRTSADAVARFALGAGGLVELALDAAAFANSRAMQAGAQSNATELVVLAAFYEPGAYAPPAPAPAPWPRPVSVAVDAPCLLTLRESLAADGSSAAVLALASPDTVGLTVRVSLGAALRPGCAPVEATLNDPASGRDLLGRSVVTKLQCALPPGCCVASN
jgi:hypothetical protein